MIANNIQDLRNIISSLAVKYGRAPADIKLLAVSKGQPIQGIDEALRVNQTSYGENYLQEALQKIHVFKEQQLEWHYLGRLQRNKLKKIAENFDWVQTITSSEHGALLNDYRPSTLSPLSVCIQINVAGEVGKNGITAETALDLCKRLMAYPKLSLCGIMTILPANINFQDQRKYFHTMHQLFSTLKKSGFDLDTLSMGMTEDLEASIAEGSTLVRVGRGIFGDTTTMLK